MHKFLVFSSVGDRNNSHSWSSTIVKKKFDLVTYYYGNNDVPNVESDLLVKKKGLKFENFHHFLSHHDYRQYEAIWVVDDDIIMNTESINSMFNIFTKHQLYLAQPSFNVASKRPWAITQTNSEYLLRYTNFVENGVALFSTDILAKLIHSFKDAKTGFGVDFIWPSLLNFPKDKIAVIDAVNCIHPNDDYSSLNQVVPRHLHRVQGTQLLMQYGLLPKESDPYQKPFIHPFKVDEYGGIKTTD